MQVEGPTMHVFVEILEVRVVINPLEVRLPLEIVREDAGQRAFTSSNVAGDGYVFLSSTGHAN